uniref:Hemagglutinin n=1 Tax=Old quarry swamp virus TaxID=2485876 RepID=A0A3G3BTT0_9VIRU|nr:hemagglutinin [Old quarry swamp virus]
MISINTFLIASIISNWVSQNTGEHLACTKPSILKEPLNVDMDIESSDSEILVFEYPKTVDTILAARRKWFNYCYDGTSLDPNTGCSSSTKNLPPGRKEAIEWGLKRMCRIGHQCGPDGSCWGSDAAKCHDDSTPYYVRESNLRWVGQRSMMFLHHSCISSWECKIHKTSFPIIAHYQSGTITLQIPMANGSLVEIPDDEDRKISISEYEVLYIIGETRQKSYSSKASCIMSPSKVACIVQDPDKGIDSVPFNLEKGIRCTTHRNYIFCVKAEIKGWNSLNKPIVWEGSKIEYAPAAVLSVEEVTEELITTNLKNGYNTIQLVRGINQLTRIVNTMVESLAKIDDHLVGALINKDLVTTWITPKIFRLCQASLPIRSEKSCINGRKYKMGRFVKTEEFCVGVNKKEVLNVSLFNDLRPFIRDYETNDVLASSDHLNGWSWIAEHKSHIVDMIGSFNQTDEGTKVTAGLSLIPSFDFGKYMSLVSFILSVFNFTVLCIFFRR